MRVAGRSPSDEDRSGVQLEVRVGQQLGGGGNIALEVEVRECVFTSADLEALAGTASCDRDHALDVGCRGRVAQRGGHMLGHLRAGSPVNPTPASAAAD